jgi:FtsX-like permease family protein
MIRLVLSMIGARRAQAVTVFVLAAVAVAAAVAGPVALRTVDKAIVRQEVDAATNTERSISVTAFVNPSEPQAAKQFDTLATLLTLPGFDPIRAGELEAFGPVGRGGEVTLAPTSRVAFRDRLCEHITILSGRCLVGALEIVVGQDTATATGLRPGDMTIVQAARYVLGRGLIPDGEAALLTVVGVYRPTNPTELYWAGQRYFPISADGSRKEAVFTTAVTFDIIDHSLGQDSVDALAPASTLTAERLERLPDEIAVVTEPLLADTTYAVNTDLPALSDRVDRSRELAGQLVPIAFVPLAAISLFVIYLAVGYGVFGRRPELGLVALRGVSSGRRWWLATGETAVAILAGAPVGYVLGHLGVGAVARWRLGATDGAGLSTDSLPYAGAALLIALAVAMLGQRRALREPVVELLRGVPRGRIGWRSIVVEALIGALAVVATVQLRIAANGLSGVGLLVPGLVVVAVAVLAARAFVPVSGMVARSALMRGRLAAGLSAVQLARRPGSQRLFVLLAVASAMLAFVAAGTDVAARAREDRALVATGAIQVLTVDQADPQRLLAVTRAVDPAGAWAMAAMTVAQANPTDPPVLAVDSARLPNVSVWRPEFGDHADNVARALAPPEARPFVFRGSQLQLDVETVRNPQDPALELDVEFVPLGGGDVINVPVKDLAAGRATRQLGVSGCASGCRLTGLSIPVLRADQVRLYVHAVRQVDPPAEVVPAADLIRRERWRPDEVAQVGPFQQALAVSSNGSAFFAGALRVAAVDAPLPVPVVGVGDAPSQLTSLDNAVVITRQVADLALLPRLGTRGVLVDLDYLERTALFPVRRDTAEVWLGPAAPPDAAERLRKAGLAVSGETGVDASRAALDRQGPALALQFHLAAAIFGILLALGGLGLVAAVDRRQRSDDFRALRQQGLSARLVRLAALWGYLSTVLLAAATGLACAGVAWLAAGDRLPVFTDSLNLLNPPRWPAWPSVFVPWAAAAATMVLASWVAAAALRRTASNGKG